MARKKWTEYWVEYDFRVTERHGRIPFAIATFKTEAEAKAFAVTVDDANIIGAVECEQM